MAWFRKIFKLCYASIHVDNIFIEKGIYKITIDMHIYLDKCDLYGNKI